MTLYFFNTRLSFQGILYDLGYACTSSNYSTIPTPEFYGLPKIALIQRGGPPGSSACTFRVKLQLAIDQGAVGALVFNNANDTALDGATAALSETEKSPLDFPAVLIAYEDGVTLKTYLEQTKDISGTDFYNRVRVNMVLDRRIPVVWEFVLIVVVVLLAISLSISGKKKKKEKKMYSTDTEHRHWSNRQGEKCVSA